MLVTQSKNENETTKKNNILKDEKFWQKPLFRQLFMSLGPIALIFSSGMAAGIATVMMPELKRVNSTIHLEAEMETWLYSAHGLGAALSAVTLPYVGQIIGYKLPFLFICVPIIVGFILQYFTTSALVLLVGTILQGMTFGGNGTLGIIIISEVVDPKYRGSLLILKGATFYWGVWISNAIGSYSSWRNIPLVGIWPVIFAIIIYVFCPESPYWLASKGRVEECEKSFHWLRGRGLLADNELSLLLSTECNTPKNFPKNLFNSLLTTVSLRQFYMPLFINMVLFFFYQSCAKHVCQNYVLDIIKNITGSESLAYSSMLILDGVTVAGMYLGSYIALKVGRRPMLMTTSACTILFMYLFSLFLYLVQLKFVSSYNTVSLCLLTLYTFSVSWGPMVLCTAIYSELAPMRYKPFITSAVLTFNYILSTVFLKLAPFLFKSIGVNGSFAVFATLALISLAYIYKYLPETSNISLEEIELYFSQQKYFEHSSQITRSLKNPRCHENEVTKF